MCSCLCCEDRKIKSTRSCHQKNRDSSINILRLCGTKLKEFWMGGGASTPTPSPVVTVQVLPKTGVHSKSSIPSAEQLWQSMALQQTQIQQQEAQRAAVRSSSTGKSVYKAPSHPAAVKKTTSGTSPGLSTSASHILNGPATGSDDGPSNYGALPSGLVPGSAAISHSQPPSYAPPLVGSQSVPLQHIPIQPSYPSMAPAATQKMEVSYEDMFLPEQRAPETAKPKEQAPSHYWSFDVNLLSQLQKKDSAPSAQAAKPPPAYQTHSSVKQVTTTASTNSWNAFGQPPAGAAKLQ
ncbi:proteophosphoglycan ppg1 [Planoprotostelium fungivorum]|uniref:Proteophosphoglycan ppg1 n=1 Tax=Planoprotostelium fungivorum TaxID=1890364 RepID=A0A2P6N4Z2_9EUKA|nr:proteophosphoglycan ppg1 [Planoprotostelium fungivorum]